jgi:hypothetical protein
MDILALSTLTLGAFAGGVTVGALVFSPRLVSMTSRADVPPSERPAMYVLPGQPGAPAAPVIPPGYVVAPGMILGQSGGPAASRQTSQAIPLIMPASDRAREGHPREGCQ